MTFQSDVNDGGHGDGGCGKLGWCYKCLRDDFLMII